VAREEVALGLFGGALMDAHARRELARAFGTIEGMRATLQALAAGYAPDVAVTIGKVVATERALELLLGAEQLDGLSTACPQPGDNREGT
jgi:hypothetical protein